MYRKFGMPLMWAAGIMVLMLTAFSCSGNKDGETYRTVRFDSNGGSPIEPQSLPDGALPVEPEDPQRENFKFAHWFSDTALASVFDFNTPVKSDLTLYAKWLTTFTVTFESNGGSLVSPLAVAENETADRPINPTKTGEGFVGWYTENALTNEYDFDTPVTHNITLYAKWSSKTYTVTFNATGGRFEAANSEVDPHTVGDGGTVSMPIAPVKAGFTLTGWFKEAALSHVFDFDTRITADITLYAKWEAAALAVQFMDDMNVLYQANALCEIDANGAIVYRVPAYRHLSTDSPIPSKGEDIFFRRWEDGAKVAYTTGSVIPPVPDSSFMLYADWLDTRGDDTGDALLKDLEDLLDDITDRMNGSDNENAEFDDEYLIGDGAFVNASSEQTAFTAQLNAKIAEANTLKQGTTHTATIEVLEGAAIVSRPVTYTKYDYAGISAVIAALRELMADPLFDPTNFAPNQVLVDQSGSVHSITVTKSGIYEIEVWGASGGHMYPINPNFAPVLGGKGGYAKGRIALTAGNVLKVRVGGEGEGSASYDITAGFSKIESNYTGTKAGGYNGGGGGGFTISDTASGSGGGGATDVRLLAEQYNKGTNNRQNGITTNGADGKDPWTTRIIVAGGGGGASHAAHNYPGLVGGNAGEDGNCLVDRGSIAPLTNARAGGTEATEPIPNISTGNILGQGGTGRNANNTTEDTLWEGNGGGGGGYYGGEAIIYRLATSSGAGGSNYTGTLTNTSTDLNPAFGPGKAVIKWVGN